ncbi:histidine phosphatase family protein [Aeromonas salmonicida]
MDGYRKISLFLLRHGQCQGGEDIIRGRTDVPLTQSGFAQMQATWRSLLTRVAQGSRLASSPLQRCHTFAQSLENKAPLVGPLQCCHWASEMDFGRWDGLPQSEVCLRWPELSDGFWRAPERHTPPNGESLEHFCFRVWQGWQAWLGELNAAAAPGALLVCHAGVMRVLLSQIVCPDAWPGAPWFTSLELPYAATVEISVYLREGSPPFYRLHWPCQML